jgi:hypothetical protein
MPIVQKVHRGYIALREHIVYKKKKADKRKPKPFHKHQ